ncbi:MAG: hypothetical protein E7338_02465 [Clostridiales bacterium]|nr:hypothetical protein [Clostridiales bacterium]
MRKSKIILAAILAIILIATMLITLIGCDFGSTPIDPGQGQGDGRNDDGDDGGGKVTPPTPPTPPVVPPAPPTPVTPVDPENPGSTTPGTKTTYVGAYLAIAQLIGGTKVSEGEGKYRTLNLYADIVQRDAGVAEVTKKRLIFRTNIDTTGGRDSEYVLKMLDMTGVEKPTPTPDSESGEGDEGDDDDSDPSTSLLSLEGEGGSIDVGASISNESIEAETEYESQGEFLWALYTVGGKMYLDKGDDQPLLYFEDFDMDYVNAIADSLLGSLSDGVYDGQLNGDLFKMLDDLMGVITINKILGLLVTYIFPSPAKLVTVTDELGNATTTYTLEIGVNSLITKIKGLVSLIFSLGLFELPFDLQLDPLMTFLNDITPKMVVNITGTTYKEKGASSYKTTSFGLEVTDNNSSSETYNQLLLDFDMSNTIIYADQKLNLDIPEKVYNATNYETFSLTNLAFSLDIMLDSNGSLDVGSVLNTIVGKNMLPTDTIIVDAATGIRLQLALDADLNYGKEVYIGEDGKEHLVDNNYIVLELYLIDTVGQLVDPEALIAIYYMDGAVYANLGHLLERYYSGSNIKINLQGIPDVIQYVVDLVSGALDKVFIETLKWGDWVTWNELWQSKYGAGDTVSTAQEGEEILSASEIGVVSLATDEYGNHVVSTNLVTFLKAVGAVVGLGDIFGMNDEKTAIEITVNTILFNGIKALAGDLGFELPDGLVAVLAINIDPVEGGIDSITISAAVDDRVGYKDKDGNWYLGKKALYNPILFTDDGEKCYEDAALSTLFTFTEDDPRENYDVVYVKDSKFYLDKEYTIELVIGYNAQGKPGAYKDGVATGISETKSGNNTILRKGDEQIVTTWAVSAYIFKGEWVIGYGLDDGDYFTLETPTYAEGLKAMISLHDFMLLYQSDYLDRFDPEKGGTNYKGYYGASSNIEGYILSKTHTRQRVNLTSTSVGTYYTYNNITKEYTKVNVGPDTEAGQTPFDPNVEYYSIVENAYVDSISKWIDTLLAGTFFSMNLVIEFSAGKYNLAPLISLFLPEIADKQLIWEFTGDFTMDVSLNIGISLNKEDPSKSKVVLELVANKDLMIARSEKPTKLVEVDSTTVGTYYIKNIDGSYTAKNLPSEYDANATYYDYYPEMLLFGKGMTILGVYGVGNKVYAELENVKLLNIVLPNLSMELDYTTLLYSLIGDKEIFDLTFNIMDLINGSGEEETSGSEESSAQAPSTATENEPITTKNLADQFDGDISEALGVFINSDVVAVSASIAGIQKLLAQFGVDLGISLTDVMDLAVSLVLNRTSGVYLDITGALVPKYDEEENKNVFDDDLLISLRLATDAEYNKEEGITAFAENETYYTYNEATNKYVKVASTATFDPLKTYYTIDRVATPVEIGDVEELLNNYEVKFETLASQADQYYDDLIQAILKVIGDLQLTITIDAKVLNSVWDINKIIDTIVADRADRFALPINVVFDDWETEVQLAVQWYLDLNNFKNTQILIEIRYEGNVWIGLYIYNGSIVLDLNGLGLFDVEVANLKLISSLGTVIQSLLGSLGDLSLTGLIGGLIEGLVNPEEEASNAEEGSEGEETSTTEGAPSATEGDTSATEGDPSEADPSEAGEGTKDPSNDLVSMLLAAVGIQNTTLGAHLTADVFEAIFRELVGFSMYLEFDISAELDIKEGRLGLGVGVERSVFADITLQLAAGERGKYKFDKDLDAIPDWNAINGEYLIKSILKNLELGLYIDLDNYNSTNGTPMYTRIYLERLDKTVSLAQTNGAKASKGSILVSLVGINESEFNNSTVQHGYESSGNLQHIAYIELNYNTGKLYLTICSGLIEIIVDIGDTVGTVEIDLDLVGMLGPTLDGLLEQISGLLGGLLNTTDSNLNEVVEAVTDEQQQEEEEEPVVTSDIETIQLVEVVSTYEWGANGNVLLASNEGKYYLYNDNVYVIELNNSGNPVQASLTKAGDITDESQLPEPSASLEKKYYVMKVAQLDEEGNEVKDTNNDTVYDTYYYICKAGTGLERRTYKFYKSETVNGLSGYFSSLDIISLFDMLTLYLSCDKTSKVGVLNADITVNAYQINNLLDHLMYYIFGPETILDLSKMALGDEGKTFSKNYLADVHWDRQNANAFWDELWDQVPGLLLDILDILAGVDVKGLSFIINPIINGLEGTVKGLLARFVPFAVANETHLGLNIVRGQLTNIYLTMQDHNTNIYDDEGNPYTFNNGTRTVSYNGGRSTEYFTNLHIFNTSPAVGNQEYTSVDGAITWDNTPTTITYNPYMYADDATAASEIFEKYFGTGHVATFQRATELYKATMSFVYQGTSTAITRANLQEKFATPGTYYITATAPFKDNTRTLTIKLVVLADQDNGGAITEIDTQTMFVYQTFPAYIFMYTADGKERRIETSALKFASTQDGENPDTDSNGNWTIIHDFNYASESENGDWEQTILVKFPNDVIAPMKVHYKNSTITNVILEGATDNTIDVDLYQFNTEDTLANYTPDKLFFTYYDGTAGNLPIVWDEQSVTAASELFHRVDSNYANVLDEDGDPIYRSVKGASYKLVGTVAKGTNNEQVVEITFNVPARKVSSVSFGSRTNILDVQPYEYYLYLTDNAKYAKYNPYQDIINVNYDTYQEKVAVVWENIESGIDYSWDITKTKTSTCQVKLDPDYYPSGDIFTWTQNVDVTVSRNQIQGIYFDEALTQTTLLIDPYAYHNAKDAFSYYPKTAWVKFTNGKVLEMPIAFRKSEIEALTVDYATDYTQFTIAIGFDIDAYDVDGSVTPFSYGTSLFFQEYTVNARVDGTAIKGVALAGSEYMGGSYKIDPIEVDFLKQAAFPSSVSVVYEDNTTGNMNVVKWEVLKNEAWEQIDLKTYTVSVEQKINQKARCYLTSDLYFDITYEILDRTASMMTVDTSDITKEALNPYAYTVQEDGTLTYDVFESTMDVKYATSFNFKLYDLGEDGVFGKNPLNDDKNDDILVLDRTVTSTTDLKALRKEIKTTYRYVSATGLYVKDDKTFKLVETSEYTEYSLPVTWDTSKLNLTREGSSETVYFTFGEGDYEIKQFVDVEFAPKNIDYIEATDYIYNLYLDEDGNPVLSSAEIAAQAITRTMKVYFTDGTFDYMDVELDLTTARSEDDTLYGYNAIANKTKYVYSETEVGATDGTYYVLGRYASTKLRGNETTNDLTKTYYTFTQIETSTVTVGNVYYVENEDSFIPVYIDSADRIGTFTYYTREVAVVDKDTTGTYYTLNDTASDRNAYVKIEVSTSSKKYNTQDGYKYYTLDISQYYTVEATIGQISPALTQKTLVTMYVLG